MKRSRRRMIQSNSRTESTLRKRNVGKSRWWSTPRSMKSRESTIISLSLSKRRKSEVKTSQWWIRPCWINTVGKIGRRHEVIAQSAPTTPAMSTSAFPIKSLPKRTLKDSSRPKVIKMVQRKWQPCRKNSWVRRGPKVSSRVKSCQVQWNPPF